MSKLSDIDRRQAGAVTLERRLDPKKRDYVKAVNGFVKRANVDVTKREKDGVVPAGVAQLLSRTWFRQALAVAVIGVLVTLIGPFGSFVEMRLPTRAAFWMTLVALSWLQWVALDRLADALAERLFEAKPWPWWLQGVAICVLGAALLTIEVPLLRGFFGQTGNLPFGELFAWIAGVSLLIYAVVSGVMLWAETMAGPVAEEKQTPPGMAEARFLRRLPQEKRGQLICIKTEDHYLRVTTEAGEALILMRLKDALAELAGADGLQVHRSYWVARPAVRRVRRDGRKRRLVLANGLDVPVSDSFVPALKAAGWFDGA